MIQISSTTIGMIGGIIAIGGTIFTIFFYFQRPQLALEKRVATLEDDLKNTHKEIEIIRATHLENNGSIQKEMKELTKSVTDLSLTVNTLSTIINERIPKGSPNLTPAGT